MLRVSGNGIRSLPPLPPRLRILEASDTLLRDLPAATEDLAHLREVDLSGTPMCGSPRLPESAKVFRARKCRGLDRLCPTLPQGLRVLSLNGSLYIKSLSPLPPTLEVLEVDEARLFELSTPMPTHKRAPSDPRAIAYLFGHQPLDVCREVLRPRKAHFFHIKTRVALKPNVRRARGPHLLARYVCGMQSDHMVPGIAESMERCAPR